MANSIALRCYVPLFSAAFGARGFVERLRRVCRPQFYEGFAVQIQRNWRFEVTNLVMTNIAMV